MQYILFELCMRRKNNKKKRRNNKKKNNNNNKIDFLKWGGINESHGLFSIGKSHVVQFEISIHMRNEIFFCLTHIRLSSILNLQCITLCQHSVHCSSRRIGFSTWAALQLNFITFWHLFLILGNVICKG